MSAETPGNDNVVELYPICTSEEDALRQLKRLAKGLIVSGTDQNDWPKCELGMRIANLVNDYSMMDQSRK